MSTRAWKYDYWFHLNRPLNGAIVVAKPHTFVIVLRNNILAISIFVSRWRLVLSPVPDLIERVCHKRKFVSVVIGASLSPFHIVPLSILEIQKLAGQQERLVRYGWAMCFKEILHNYDHIYVWDYLVSDSLLPRNYTGTIKNLEFYTEYRSLICLNHFFWANELSVWYIKSESRNLRSL